MRWTGPHTIEELLENSLDPSFPRPPEAKGVYVLSEKPWRGKPRRQQTKACNPLYVGGNTGKSARFRTRIGDLIADVFGFFGNETGHHSGGRSLHEWCRREKVNPGRLYIGWAEDCNCVRCAENELYDLLRPSRNKNRPYRCKDHNAGAQT